MPFLFLLVGAFVSIRAYAQGAPTADANGPYSGTAGQVINFSSSGSDDADGSIDSYAWTFGDGGSSTDANPTYAYASAGNYTVTLIVTDNDGLPSAAANTSADIEAANVPPVGFNDSYSTNDNIVLAVNEATGVLSNDTDADGDTLTASLVDNVNSGVLLLAPDGSFVYTPILNFSGSDSFSYRADDGTDQSDVTIVSITINFDNDAPTANDDTYNTPEDTPLSVNPVNGVLANDTDDDDDALTAVLDADVTNGTLVLNADGSFDYTPNPDFNGEDSFTYHANDGTADSTPVAVTITVGADNDPPVAVADAYATPEDTSLAVPAPGVLTNDTDAEEAALTAALVGDPPANGQLTLNADGSFDYTPNADFSGSDSFSYVANDGEFDSPPATVVITIEPANDAPIALDDSYETDEDTTIQFADPGMGLLANDTDPDGDVLTAEVFTSPEHGLLTINANGTFTYNPDANYQGPDLFVYRVTDGLPDVAGPVTATAVIQIADVNDPPEGPDEPINAGIATETVPYEFDLGPYFSDNDGDALYFRANVGEHPTGLPLSGNLRIDEDGSLTGVPGRIFGTITVGDTSDDGPRTITITVADRPFSDPEGEEITATVLLTLAARDRVDISLTGAATPDPALVGQSVTWELTITNTSPLESVDQIALEFTFGGVPTVISTAPGCTIATPNVSCLVGPLPPEGVLVQTITAQPGEPGESTLWARAAIERSTGFEPVDPDPANNEALLTVNVGEGFSSGPSQSVGSSSRGSAAGDINGDGYVDLMLARSAGQSTELYLSEPDDSSNPDREPYRVIGTTPIQLGDSGVASQDALLADIDNDQDLDLIVANGGPGSPQPNSVYLNESVDGLVQLTATTTPLGNQTTWDLAAADVNLDGLIDIVAANGSPNEVFLNLGGGQFSAAQALGDADSRAVAIADFDGDGWPDLVFANLNGPSSMHAGLGDGTFGPAIEIEQQPAISVQIGEFGGDGLPDLVFSHPDATPPATPIKTIHINQSVPGAPAFSRTVTPSLGSSATLELAMLDTDLDGDDDIVSLNRTGTHQIFLADGGAFALHPLQFSSPSPTGSATGDFNSDGRADLAVSGPSGTQIFLNDGHGNLGPGDITPPVLTLLGAPTVTLTVGTAFNDAGASATDDADGSLTSRIVVDNPVNSAVIGSYTVTYRVTDLSGNDAAPVTRRVSVQASQPTGGGGGGSFGVEVLVLIMFACILRWRYRTGPLPLARQ